MPIRYGPSAATGQEGEDYVALACSRDGHTLYLQRPHADIGLDGTIEVLDGNLEPSGAVAFVQVKSGKSFVRASGEYVLVSDKDHFQAWSRYSVPLIGVVYNPERADARWACISDHIRNHPKCIDDGPYSIVAPESQPFSEHDLGLLRDLVLRQSRAINTAEATMSEILASDDPFRKTELLTTLFSMYRWTPAVCLFLHFEFKMEQDADVLRYLAYLMSFYRSHYDRWYTVANSIPKNYHKTLTNVASRCIALFTGDDVRKMLALVDDENGIERGSFGQLVAIQLASIPEFSATLRRIAADRANPTQIRHMALMILCEYGKWDARFMKRLRQTEQDRLIREDLTVMLESWV